MRQDVQQHHPCMEVAEVFSALIRIRQIAPPDAMVIAWADAMKESSRMQGDELNKYEAAEAAF